MKIASWNINSLRKRRIVCLRGWRRKPDVVCLQETKCTDEQFPELALQRPAITPPFTARNRTMASPFFLGTSCENVRPSLCDEVDDPQARVIAATIDNVRVFSVYAPNGQAVGSPAYEYKLKWYARCAIASVRQRNFVELPCAVISMSRRKMWMSMIQSLARRHHVFGWRARRFSQLCANRFERHAAFSSPKPAFQLVGLPHAGVSEESRIAHRRDPGQQITRGTLHRCRNRSRYAQRQRAIRSCAGLGRVFAFVT